MENNEVNNLTVLEALRSQFGEKIGNSEEPFGLLTIDVDAEAAHDIIHWLKEHAVFKVQFLTNIAGVHYPDNKGQELVVVYHLHSFQNNFRIRLKAYLSSDNPVIASVTDLYAAANWIERETYDFFGVVFENHPDLRRILNEETMDYFPLRKEYQLEDTIRQDKDNRFFGR